MIQIYHNPRCGKSRNCIAFITEKEIDFKIITYLITPPSKSELTILLKQLNFKPLELVRQKEKIWIEKYKNKNLTEDEIIQTMVSNPILIERPILIEGDKAIIARDIEVINSFLKKIK